MNDDPLLSGAPNFRDLGGYATAGGERVRRGLLYRADALARLDGADVAALRGLGLRHIIDLRTVFEREHGPDTVPEGVEYTVLDVQGRHSTGADLAAILSDPERAAELLADNGAERFMHAVNRALVSGDDAREAYRELVQQAAEGPTAMVFHCSAGKDRTGWGAALLLELLGVPRETVVEDYLASNGRLRQTRAWMAGNVRANGIDPELVTPMIDVRRAYLESAYAEVEEVYGSFEGYVADGLKLRPETVAALRGRMLE
ncbi:tyrosine-protein phosphatase [Nocardiopsis trehalosi]|jgi:protein-tyrosine phosphatase|uniref:tyrosine-protein phosphatase n=1 Tax=Nocardiopsis trehalosi TaxID=109329 RepID=UPI00082EBB93|nr:tyrosine-protein phosphatase [Nocardiopsis trehalosi]